MTRDHPEQFHEPPLRGPAAAVPSPQGPGERSPGRSASSRVARASSGASTTHRRRPTSRVHARLGPYVLERLLGRGGMGNVYLGRHRVLEVHHALKVLSSHLAHIPAIVQRFAREARSAFRLRHPHIVQVYGADSYQGTRYIAMEYVEGRTLAEHVHNGPLRATQTVWFLYQVALALGYAHRQGVVHRDVKPDNVLVDAEGIAKLTDFGLVRRIDPVSLEPALTHNGVMVGTPDFMAPEQWHAETVDGRADVFSLGVLGYAMLCKRLPFPGKNPALVYRRQQQGGPDPMPAGVDATLRRIVLRCLQVEPLRRYQSADDVADELAAWWQANVSPTGRELPALSASNTQTTQTERLLAPCVPSALASSSGSSHRMVTAEAVTTDTGTREQPLARPKQATRQASTHPTPAATPKQAASSRRRKRIPVTAHAAATAASQPRPLSPSSQPRLVPENDHRRRRWLSFAFLALVAAAAAIAGTLWLG